MPWRMAIGNKKESPQRTRGGKGKRLLKDIKSVKNEIDSLNETLNETDFSTIENSSFFDDWKKIEEKLRINRTLIREIYNHFSQEDLGHTEVGQLIKEMIRNDRFIIDKLATLRQMEPLVGAELRQLGKSTFLVAVNNLRFVKSLEIR